MMLLPLSFIGHRLRLNYIVTLFIKYLSVWNKIIWLKVENVQWKSDLKTYGEAFLVWIRCLPFMVFRYCHWLVLAALKVLSKIASGLSTGACH